MYWLNENSRLFLERGYLLEGVSAEERIRQIADKAEEILKIDGFADKFYDYMSKGYYSLSSPVWSNFGLGRGFPISCYNSHLSDNLPSIMYAQAEVGMMSKVGGGTSGYFGDLRPRGAKISDNGESSGAVHFMNLFESVTDIVSQGGVRRGRFAPYLPVEHPDILEFLEIGTEGNEIQDLTYGVTVTDAWMMDMIAGDEEKRAIWAKILQRRVEIGYPYIFFTDTVNRNTVDVYKDNNLKINSSNLCVSGDTRILTNKGQIEIKHLAGSQVKVWNGEEYSNVLVQKTGENQKLVRVITSGGQELEVTPYHKFYIAKTDKSGKMIYPASYKEVRAEELKADDKLIKFNLPIIKGEIELENAYDNGFFSGDGTHEPTGRYKLYLYNEKKDLAEFFNSVDKWYDQSEFGRLYGYPKNMKPKFFVPGGGYTVESRVKWLAGYLDADGTVAANGTNQSLQAASINKEFLLDVQLMLQTLGVTSKVTLNKKAGKTMLPKNDGSGEYGEYDTKEIYRILINSSGLYKLHELGLKTNRLDWTPRKPQRNAEQFIKVLSVEEVEGEHDTFCFNEPKRHMGMFNGLLTGQCSEIMLPSNDEWSFVCNLSSMNLFHYDEWKDTDAVETLTYFLDAVMEEFIQKLEALRDSDLFEERQTFEFLKKTHKFAKENRALGIGALGWHSLLQSKMWPFESLEAEQLNVEIFKLIQEKTYKASREMAVLYGEPKMLKGYGRRNTTTMAIAPTTSSAFILGQVSQSIEPIWSNNYVKDVAKAKVTIQNPTLKKLLKEKGKDTREVWNSIRDNDGSVQHLEFLSELEKNVFKTFSEINQYNILEQAAARQMYIDQAQSLNIMINPKMSTKEINALHIFAWQYQIKTLYYQHSTNAAQQFNQSKICVSCEA